MISFDYSIYVTTEVHEDGKSFLLENRIHRHDAADTSSSTVFVVTEIVGGLLNHALVSALLYLQVASLGISRGIFPVRPWIINISIICGYATLMQVL